MKLYLQSLKKELKVILAVFVLASVIGFWVIPNWLVGVENFLREIIERKMGLVNTSDWDLFVMIFTNNARIAFMAIILGVFGGIFSLSIACVNGVVLGIVCYWILQKASWWLLLAGILPHGCLELPAIFLSLAIGLRIGSVAIQKIFCWQGKSVIRELIQGLKMFMVIIMPALLVAAGIEVYITPWCMAITSFLLEMF